MITPINFNTNAIKLNNIKTNTSNASKISFCAKKPDAPDAPKPKNIINPNLPEDILRQQVSRFRSLFLKPIKSEEEYESIFSRIIRYLLYDFSNNSEGIRKINYDDVLNYFGGLKKVLVEDLECLSFKGYDDIDFELKGLVPYCGLSDISRQINSWLSARKDTHPTLLSDNQMADIIRIFEYSLAKLDKKYGKYKGRAYRAGFFNPITDKQFYSASDFLSCAVAHAVNNPPSKSLPYSIIKVKRGHNIHKFQSDTATDVSTRFATIEREILIDRKSKFRLVPKSEYTAQDKYDVRDILMQTIDCDPGDLSSKRKKEILDNIFVWEEI